MKVLAINSSLRKVGESRTEMDIVTRKADGMQMFIEGKYQAEGDISLMELFGR